MDPAALRAEFPVLERLRVPQRRDLRADPGAGGQAVADVLARGALEGRSTRYFERDARRPRRACARPTRAARRASDDVALTTCTSEGIVRVLAALDLRPGDEMLTSDEEHPGLLGPLAAARAQRGIAVRAVPFAQIADAVGPQTRSSSRART